MGSLRIFRCDFCKKHFCNSKENGFTGVHHEDVEDKVSELRVRGHSVEIVSDLKTRRCNDQTCKGISADVGTGRVINRRVGPSYGPRDTDAIGSWGNRTRSMEG